MPSWFCLQGWLRPFLSPSSSFSQSALLVEAAAALPSCYIRTSMKSIYCKDCLSCMRVMRTCTRLSVTINVASSERATSGWLRRGRGRKRRRRRKRPLFSPVVINASPTRKNKQGTRESSIGRGAGREREPWGSKDRIEVGSAQNLFPTAFLAVIIVIIPCVHAWFRAERKKDYTYHKLRAVMRRGEVVKGDVARKPALSVRVAAPPPVSCVREKQ